MKSDGEFSAVREKPRVHKLGLCPHQYDCRYGQDCKFAHSQAELRLWQGVTRCFVRISAWFLTYVHVPLRVQVHVYVLVAYRFQAVAVVSLCSQRSLGRLFGCMTTLSS